MAPASPSPTHRPTTTAPTYHSSARLSSARRPSWAPEPCWLPPRPRSTSTTSLPPRHLKRYIVPSSLPFIRPAFSAALLANRSIVPLFLLQLPIYPLSDPEVKLVPTQTELERQIGSARRSLEGVTKETRQGVSNSIEKWIGVEKKMERECLLGPRYTCCFIEGGKDRVLTRCTFPFAIW